MKVALREFARSQISKQEREDKNDIAGAMLANVMLELEYQAADGEHPAEVEMRLLNVDDGPLHCMGESENPIEVVDGVRLSLEQMAMFWLTCGQNEAKERTIGLGIAEKHFSVRFGGPPTFAIAVLVARLGSIDAIVRAVVDDAGESLVDWLRSILGQTEG